MMVCADCGRVVSDATVAMFDFCPGCQTTPFREWPEGVYLHDTYDGKERGPQR